MTTYYLVIMAGPEIDHTSRFFKIAVGQTTSDDIRLHALLIVCRCHNWFIAKYDHDTADFLLKIALSLSVMPDELPVTNISVKDFMRAWKNFGKGKDSAQLLDPDRASSSNQRHFSAKIRQKNVIQHAEAIKRNKPKHLIIDFCNYLQSVL